ncbi:hypothetical protein U0035_11240 [Niabella yanshanensis]|uniref:Uncharacterized protein n=1 Tax=Niabella yanshanensis TaxID=577386 RepID=A0ABZ0WDF6_9BACT|nr:hypothetical protein [Niabella yanshanensis]WQD40723.1 hypothetical protein U0035_11240 [Niabella yanshanensis]
MKTSNKLLIGLVLLLFSFPLILVMGFKAAIKADRYIVKNNNGYEVSAPKEVKAFTAIKLNGIPFTTEFGLKAHIKYGDKFSYFIKNYDMANPEEGRTDSCRIRLVGDTLLVEYTPRQSIRIDEPNYSYGIEIDITIPQSVPVIASATSITIDSSAAALGAMNFALSAGSLDIRPIATIQGEPMPQPVVFQKITVNAHHASIKIGDQVNIKNLELGLDGTSDISFREATSIDTISGHISEASFFNAPYRYSKFLK